ncbi:MAG: hypothetical protein K2O67_06140, partial [Clostridia bacterium]|nr:hypothetical protein [Clostridia bacterium]
VIRNVVLGKVVARTHKSKKEKEIVAQEEPVQTEAPEQKVDNLYSVNENHEIVSKVGHTQPVRQTAAKPQTQEGRDDDKFSREKLGRRILFDNGEFAAESYRRNMIYNEDSYFNHPVKNEGDYLRSFSSGTPAPQNATPAESTTYTADYSSQVEERGSGTETPSYLYGDQPVENLGEHHSYSEEQEEDYSSYTVDETSAIDFEEDEPEYEEPVQAEPVQQAKPVERSPYDLNLDDEVKRTPDPEPFVQPPVQTRREEIKAEEVPAPVKPVEQQPEPEEKPKSRSSLFDLFSSSNPRLSGNRGVEPDVSAIQSQRRESSRENLFDDDSEEEDDGVNLFADQQPLTSRGVERSEEKVQPVRGVPASTEERAPVAPKPVERKPVEPPPAPVEEEKPKHVWKKYVRPTLDLLDDYPENSNINTAEIEASKQIICDTLSDYRIDSRISNVVVGP